MRHSWLRLAPLLLLPGLAASVYAVETDQTDLLARGFAQPPNSAAPRVWWHWMNGNISKEGIKLDLEWMKRIGIGGFQTFDASLGTPQVVDKRLVFMTPEWKEAFSYAASRADHLGLEMAIAGSPGWSESGGPWVTPADAMKKIVWSETIIQGGKPYTGLLPQPPNVSGPFQNKPRSEFLNFNRGEAKPPAVYYADSAVIAYRIADGATRMRDPAPKLTASGGAPDLAQLADGDLTKSFNLPIGAGGAPAWIQYEFAAPQTIYGVTLGVEHLGLPLFLGGVPTLAELQASDDGTGFRKISSIPTERGGLAQDPGQNTLALAPVTARFFRVTLNRAASGTPAIDLGPLGLPPAPPVTEYLVAAESMTAATGAWAWSPEYLKPTADQEMAMGLNRFVIHTSVHQPLIDKAPGLTLGPFGQWFTRNETWAEQAAPWISYLARSSFLLQQGHFVADVAYYYGEDSNVTALFAGKAPNVPPGYNFDFINADTLITALSFTDGAISTPGGMRYRVLALDPNALHMSLPVLRRLAQLVTAGAVVVGDRPLDTPSLADDTREFSRLVSELWGTGDGEHVLGKGAVYSGQPLDAVLKSMGVAPDVQVEPRSGTDLLFVHRHLPDGDLFYVDNRQNQRQQLEVSFRIDGSAPELWHADTGNREPASYRRVGGRTLVPMSLDAFETVFVVFRHATSAPERILPVPTETQLLTVPDSWQVQFQARRGAPEAARPANLKSWSDDSDEGIKFFSGTATYTTILQAQPMWFQAGARLWLDLGRVKNVAEISVNGKDLGIAWKAPFRVDMTSALKPGANRQGPDAVRAFIKDCAANGAKIVKFLLSGESALKPGASMQILYTEEEVRAAGAQARESNVWLTGHAHAAEAVKMGLRNGFRVLYHCTYADEEAIEMLIARKSEIFVGPTLGIVQATLDATPPPQFDMSYMKADAAVVLESQKKLGPALKKAGVRLVPGGDYGFPFNPNGRNARDLELFVRYLGYSPTEALVAATKLGGEIMGMENELGKIQPGYLADLLLVAGDPTQNIAVLQSKDNLLAIMKDGKFHKRPAGSA